MARKPMAAAVVGTLLMVVCDDGSVYEMDPNGAWIERRPVPGTPAAHADEIFSILMGEDVEQRRSFIQRNAKDVRFLDI